MRSITPPKRMAMIVLFHCAVGLILFGRILSTRMNTDLLQQHAPTITSQALRLLVQDTSELQQRRLLPADEQDYEERRALVGWGSAICSLTEETFDFRRDPDSGLYVAVNATDEEVGDAVGARSLRKLLFNNSTATEDNGEEEFISVRVCWCTEYLFGRPWEFCPSTFDTCAVPPGPNDPVSCYSTQPVDTFLHSFWPLAILWTIALVYSCTCSRSGHQARRYASRQCNTLCNIYAEPEPEPDRGMERELEHLLEHEPERAAFLFRRYVFQQWHLQEARARRQENQHACYYRFWQRLFLSRCRAPEPAVVGDEGVGEAQSNQHQPRLELKTKVFESSSGSMSSSSSEHNGNETMDDGEEDEEQGRQSSNTQTESGSESVSSTTTETGWNESFSSTTTETGWSFPHFTVSFAVSSVAQDDQVTLEEMDDELEQGNRCAICLIRIEDGDVVGDLPCPHLLHKDCLKDWLKRKNRCPLCSQQPIARFLGGIGHDNINNCPDGSDDGQSDDGLRSIAS